MDFPPEHYFQTATQRMRQAQYLYQEGSSFALAIYVGGVAVECLLRAFKGRRDPTFDEKHDLLRLFAASGMLRVDPDRLRAKHWTDAQIDAHLRTLRDVSRALNGDTGKVVHEIAADGSVYFGNTASKGDTRQP